MWSIIPIHQLPAAQPRQQGRYPTRKVIVNRVFWATHDSNGTPLSYVSWIARNNAFLANMYEIVSQVPGVRFIDYPDGLLVADASHKWGVQAYHYTNDANLHFIKEIQTRAAG